MTSDHLRLPKGVTLEKDRSKYRVRRTFKGQTVWYSTHDTYMAAAEAAEKAQQLIDTLKNGGRNEVPALWGLPKPAKS